MFAQQEQQFARAWELRRIAESAPPGVERGGKLSDARVERAWCRHRRPPTISSNVAKPLRNRLGRRLDSRAILLPRARNLLQDVDETRPSPLRRRWKVGAAVKRLQRRREPDAHGPAAGTGRRLYEGHIDAVHIGPLLAIDLDRDE